MPIRVKCPQCQTEFQVNEKFAGKKGPCPKCKNLIEVPKAIETVAAPKSTAAVASKAPPTAKPPAAAPPVTSSRTAPPGKTAPVAPSTPSKASPPTAPAPTSAKSASAPKAAATPAPPPAPKPEPKKEKVVIHEPDAAPIGAKPGSPAATMAAQRHIRPIQREEVRLTRLQVVLLVGGIIAALATAHFLGLLLRENIFLRLAGLWLTVVPTAIGSYAVLRDDELEPYRGRALACRTLACSVVYAGLWVGYWFIPADFKFSAMNWLFMAPPIIAIGAAAPTVLYDLDFGSGLAHYGFYVLVCLLLGYLAGIPGPWVGVMF